MKLPNGERANLGRKLEDYSLNPDHPAGKHKARVFASVLGLEQANAELLRDALLHQAAYSEAAVFHGQIPYGDVYELDFRFQTQKGVAMVRSGWIVRADEDFPRLVTCYIL